MSAPLPYSAELLGAFERYADACIREAEAERKLTAEEREAFMRKCAQEFWRQRRDFGAQGE